MSIKSIFEKKFVRDLKADLESRLSVIAVPPPLVEQFSYAVSGGQRLRPLLLALSGSALGGSRESSLPAMTAIELLHKFTLIHDDIVDHDDYRRGQLTFHARYGLENAIIMGDFLTSNALDAFLELANHFTLEQVYYCQKIFNKILSDLCAGELMDLFFETAPAVSLADCQENVYKRTGVLIEGSMKIGAMLGGGDDVCVSALADYGKHAGIAFQYINDVNNLTGLEKSTGRTRASDLKQGKKGLFIVHALNNLSVKDRERVAVLLAYKSEMRDEHLAEVLEICENSRSLEFVFEHIKQHLARAKQSLATLTDSEEKEVFGQILEGAKEEWYWVEPNP